MNILELLKRLTVPGGVSGLEKPVSDELCGILSEYGKVHIDNLGNVVLEIEGEGTHIVLDAHIDQVGMIVTDITPEGFLRVAACGGIDNRTLCAQQVVVFGLKQLTGVVTSIPPHLQNSESQRKAIKTDEAIIDIGMTNKEASAVVSLGDRIAIKSDFISLMGDRVSAPSLDDRSGVAAIIYALELLRNKGIKRKMTVVFSTREETTGSGAKVAAFVAGADELIAVDVSFASTPDSKPQECGTLGCGPMIGVSASLTQEVSMALKGVAIEKKIPYQLEIMGGKTGTNADAMTVAGNGMRSGLISIPLRYMHTGVETVALCDVENTGLLIAEYIAHGGECYA